MGAVPGAGRSIPWTRISWAAVFLGDDAGPAPLKTTNEEVPMRTKTIWRLGVVLAGVACMPAPAAEPDAAWRANLDAGWKAFQAHRLDEAERRLRAAEREARTLGADDPRLATTLDHLAWVLDAEGKFDEAEALAKRALEMQEA